MPTMSLNGAETEVVGTALRAFAHPTRTAFVASGDRVLD